MKYGVFNINQAAGIVLGGDMNLGAKFYPKGHVLTAEDILVFKMFDQRSVFGCEFEEGDVDCKIASHQIAAQIAGKNLGYMTENDGICKIVATCGGIFMVEESRLDKFNGFNEHIVLNTIAPHNVVQKGEILAELEVTTPLVGDKEIDEMIFKLSGNESLLSVSEVKPQKAVLIYPYLLNDEIEREHFTSVVTKLVTALEGLGIDFHREISSRYESGQLADSLFDAFAEQPDAVFVLSPQPAAGREGIIAAGIAKAADEIVNYAVPLVGAADFLIAQKGKTKIMSLPYGYASAEDGIIEEMIKEALFTEHLSPAMYGRKRSGYLRKELVLPEETQPHLIRPKGGKSGFKASVGIVVLAAGQGRRSGTNKLMVQDKKGVPMFMRAVNAAIASNARPVFVVTGHEHDLLEEELDKLDVNVLYNPSYASGIKTSISMGLKSVPTSCEGAVLLPADMPYVGAAEINKLIAKFNPAVEKQICVLTNKGVKSNPILWSKALYDKADIVPENAASRVVFAEHSDYTVTVEVKDKSKLRDLNFKNDLEEYAKSE